MKKIVLGLITAIVAFGASAFSNVRYPQISKANMSITSSFLGQVSSCNYIQVDGTGVCVASAPCLCLFKVNQPNSIPNKSNYTSTEVANYVSLGWLTPVGSNNQIYTD